MNSLEGRNKKIALGGNDSPSQESPQEGGKISTDESQREVRFWNMVTFYQRSEERHN